MTETPELGAAQPLVVTPRAVAEIQAAYDWYEDQSIGLGAEYLRALEAVYAAIRRHPASFPEVRPRIRRALLRRFPYGVFYAEYRDRTTVLAVMHARQNPRRWPRRT